MRLSPTVRSAVLVAVQVIGTVLSADPTTSFQPTVTLSADERRQLDLGEPVARVLPGSDREVSVFGAVSVSVDGDRLVAWTRRIESLKKSPYVLAIQRISNPPRLEDFSALTLDDDDLAAIRKCKPRDCALKLSGTEMVRLQQVADAAGATWRPAMQQAFRDVVFHRVQIYATDGTVPAYEDKSHPITLPDRFASIVGHLAFLRERLPEFAEELTGDRRGPRPGIESFYYWSKEKVAHKAVVSVTQVSIRRGAAGDSLDAVVAGKDIFSTHYINASLGLTSIVRGPAGGPNYLVYINRSDVDMPGGLFSGVLKWLVQRRLKSEAADLLRGLRERLESGVPPTGVTTPHARRP